ncbi:MULTISPECIES: hypothetical protein [Pandoraea]|uniref:hypothetical protein n=1 Tax=Pandoraea TaxID=93217 RepID=UPI001F5D0631|nr:MULTISPECIES: hypothetical protein [Pandoraea]MCI3204863.1 hypothetical protein [Pandoraea sp. LA3]MDN4582891.1 hypothetical protein [Pandoraea capi]
MEWSELEVCFSSPRLRRYTIACKGDTKRAAAAYPHNLQIAEALLPSLNVLEITLRNSVHARLMEVFGDAAWWNTRRWLDDGSFLWQTERIAKAKEDLRRRGEPQTPDKLVAELSFGFWTSLFNARFQGNLWGALRHAFPRCPKKIRKRDTISKALAQVRDLRNRAFHHEPLLWLGPAVDEQYTTGVEVIGWLNPRLLEWLKPIDRFPQTWQRWEQAQATFGSGVR